SYVAPCADFAGRSEPSAHDRGRRREVCDLGAPETARPRMTISGTEQTLPDRVVTAVDDRRTTILETIRGTRRRLSLSLFRCDDDEIFAEIARAVSRGVEVEVLTTTRAKGGRKRLKKLGAALGATGATVHAYADPVVKYHAKYLVADDGPALVATLNFTRKCFTRTWDALVVTHDPEVVSG